MKYMLPNTSDSSISSRENSKRENSERQEAETNPYNNIYAYKNTQLHSRIQDTNLDTYRRNMNNLVHTEFRMANTYTKWTLRWWNNPRSYATMIHCRIYLKTFQSIRLYWTRTISVIPTYWGSYFSYLI
jgi:hypothetical protein